MKPLSQALALLLSSNVAFAQTKPDSPPPKTLPLAAAGESIEQLLKSIPPKEPAEALRGLETLPGFHVEFVAHEPLVLDPVAAAIDENGFMYVAEDADYPYRPEPGERPKGRIRLLIDRDGDGYYEESHLFADGLLWPAGVAPWKGGIFASAPPDIWYLKDTNNDGIADVKLKVFSGFGTGGSQYVLNNLQWGPDHKIYAAVAGNGGAVGRANDLAGKTVSLAKRDFRFDPATDAFESISGGKQFGNTFDDWGNRFLCTQDTPVYQVVFSQQYLDRNPFLDAVEAVKKLAPSGDPIFRTSPIEAWREIRSSRRLLAERGSPDQSGISHHVLDGVAGVTLYRGGAFPPDFYGNVFVGDAQNNLVHRRSLVPDGVVFRSERLDRQTEFLRSKDNWFRPVNFVNAPDGTLYVLDLAREILEAVHIPMDVVKHLDLTRGRDRGRIYRVVPSGFQRPPSPRLGTATTQELVGLLESPHSWWRETAHRLIFERQDKLAETPLRNVLDRSVKPQARLLALWSLDGLGLLSPQDLVIALADAHPAVRENAILLAEPRLRSSPELLNGCLALVNDPNRRVRFQLALTLGNLKITRATEALLRLGQENAVDPYIRTAVLSSSYGRAGTLLVKLNPAAGPVGRSTQLVDGLSRIVGGQGDARELASVLGEVFVGDDTAMQRMIAMGLAKGLRGSHQQLGRFFNDLPDVARTHFSQLLQRSRRTLDNPQSSPAELDDAIGFVEAAGDPNSVPALLNALDRFPLSQTQTAVVRALAEIDAPGLTGEWMRRWQILSPEARRVILSALLAKPRLTAELLDTIERGQLSAAELDAAARARLLNYPARAMQERAAKLVGKTADDRAEVIQRFQPALSLKGDPRRGHDAFLRICSSCHRLNGEGNDVGPNLALAASRTPEDLLQNMLDPNREVDPAFVQYTIERQDGELLTGLVASENSDNVTLKGPGFLTTVQRSQIKKISSSGLSLMPVGLEQGLDLQGMVDLLDYLVRSQYDLGTSGHSYSIDVPEKP